MTLSSSSTWAKDSPEPQLSENLLHADFLGLENLG